MYKEAGIVAHCCPRTKSRPCCCLRWKVFVYFSHTTQLQNSLSSYLTEFNNCLHLTQLTSGAPHFTSHHLHSTSRIHIGCSSPYFTSTAVRNSYRPTTPILLSMARCAYTSCRTYWCDISDNEPKMWFCPKHHDELYNIVGKMYNSWFHAKGTRKGGSPASELVLPKPKQRVEMKPLGENYVRNNAEGHNLGRNPLERTNIMRDPAQHGEHVCTFTFADLYSCGRRPFYQG